MNNEKLGQFIAELRKSKQMTQKELAAKLNITDKAVSKWERGRSCPDISLLAPLAELLGVTVSELLNGEKKENEDVEEEVESTVGNALQYAKAVGKIKTRSALNIAALVFSLAISLGIITCGIVDLAMSGTFTWSTIPISASVFGWLVLFPVIKFGKKGIVYSLLSFSVFELPFLFLLSKLVPENEFMIPMSVPISIISLVFLWLVFVLFRVLKIRKTLASAFALLLAIPTTYLINFTVSKILSEPNLDAWDIMTVIIMLIGTILLFVLDFTKRKKSA